MESRRSENACFSRRTPPAPSGGVMREVGPEAGVDGLHAQPPEGAPQLALAHDRQAPQSVAVAQVPVRLAAPRAQALEARLGGVAPRRRRRHRRLGPKPNRASTTDGGEGCPPVKLNRPDVYMDA